MSVFWNFIGDNAFQVDAKAAEDKIREKYPKLLHKDEHVELAFKDRGGAGRDKEFFTNRRILIKDGKGIGSKRRNYLSLLYEHIQAFAVETSGNFDGDVELKVWTSGHDYHRFDFAKGQVDIFAVKQFLNSKVHWKDPLGAEDEIVFDSTPSSLEQKSSSLGNFFDWLGDNAKALDPKDVERHLKTVTPVLLADEIVDMAFKSGRDTTLFTSKRLMIVDVKGFSGKSVEFQSFLWTCISAFAVETAGAYFDRDTEMTLHTNIMHHHTKIDQDFRKNKVDVFPIQKYLANKILGVDDTPLPEVDLKQGHVDPKTSWWFREDQRPLDAVEMDRFYHTSPPILQGKEKVEMAFKGRRDITLLTTKRLIIIDPKGWKGVKIEYTSVPWRSVLAFGAETAGKYFDKDNEIKLWTDMMYIPGGGEDNPPEPGMSMLELEFNKNLVNIMDLKRYLSLRLLQADQFDSAPIPLASLTADTNDDEGFEDFWSGIANDGRAIDPTEINNELHTTKPILLDNERVLMAFKAGRDLTLFTTLRVMIIDVQGWSGEKISYDSIPYSSIRGFSAESAGSWDRDSEVDLYTRNRWEYRKIRLDFRKGKADIIMIQKFLSSILLGDSQQDAMEQFLQNPNLLQPMNLAGMDSFMSWMTDNSTVQEASVVDHQLHNEPPILLQNERVLHAFKQGRDMFVFTTKRFLLVDVQGLLGKKVEYKSFVWKWCRGFEFETAGHLDRDAEVYTHWDIPDKKKIELSILVSKYDIYDMHQFLSSFLLFGEAPP